MASDRDQRTAEEDQRAADGYFAAGGDPLVYDRGVRARERSAQEREVVSTMRDQTAAERLKTAEERDRAAELRDRRAEAWDRLARLHDLEDDTGASREDVLLRAQRDRRRAAADRARAADDRRRAAEDRAEAARDRAEAHSRHMDAAEALVAAMKDELTGAWTRGAGLAAVSRELERAHRTGAKLVLAFIDVDGLKEVNDSDGHVAGDAVLRLVGHTIRSYVRAYDVVVRYGGDELLCAMPNVTAADATRRLREIAGAVTTAHTDRSITFGVAEAEPTDTLQELVVRADAALLAARSSAQS
ncbi:MAG: GGDEF domain-containing protein [Actinomycetota bacterium]|nr:GGDEF domain-containing protein [Actinomycetota bacterium]